MGEYIGVGLSHQSAPIAVREKLALPDADLEAELGRMAKLPGVSEVMVVSTCNRVEVLAHAANPSAAQSLVNHLVARGGEPVRGHLQVRSGEQAVVHLFRVASSLESMVVGEPQILGQVKDAFELAQKLTHARGDLTGLCQAAFGAAKRVRTETAIGSSSVSMASAAVELARKLYGSLSGRTVLVVGAGAMAELCARHLAGQSAKVWVANRTPEKARALCEAVGPRAEPRPFESLPALLAEADVVVTSTAAREPIFTVERVQAALKARKNRPLFLVDLAVPRDVDPAVQALDNVFTYDVDDLSRVVQDSLAARMQEARKAEVIVAEEAARFVRARAAREAVPVLAQLRQRAEGLARAEAEKTLAALGPGLTDKQKKSVEAMARAIVNKLLHAPTARLRTAGEEGPEAAARVAQAAAELFDLQPDSSPGREDA